MPACNAAHLEDESDAVAHIRVDVMEYEVTDDASAIRAGRVWVWLARAVAYVAKLLGDLDTGVLLKRKVSGLHSLSKGPPLGQWRALMRVLVEIAELKVYLWRPTYLPVDAEVQGSAAAEQGGVESGVDAGRVAAVGTAVHATGAVVAAQETSAGVAMWTSVRLVVAAFEVALRRCGAIQSSGRLYCFLGSVSPLEQSPSSKLREQRSVSVVVRASRDT